MSNMSYCRFQNTLSDLSDCHHSLINEHKTINDLSKDEARAFREMYELMEDFISDINGRGLLDEDEEDDDWFASHDSDYALFYAQGPNGY